MIKGNFKIVNGVSVTGWVFSEDKPDLALLVRIKGTGGQVIELIADQPRPHLSRHGLENINHGFSYTFASQVTDPAKLAVSCKLASGDEIELQRLSDKRHDNAPAKFSESSQHGVNSPVFIVGSPRSGTSALANVLSALGFDGFKEGNYLSLIHALDKAVDHQFNSMRTDVPKVMITHIDRHELKDALFDAAVVQVKKLNPKHPWFDKTGNPGMILSIPIIAKLWPNSVFILAKRRAIENIMSRLKKFPQHSFEYHCKDWVANFRAWREICKDLPENRRMEIDQRDMVAAPDIAATKLKQLLALDDQQLATITSVLTKKRPQETTPGSSEKVVGLESTGWTQEQKQTFIKLCGEEMKRQGYSMDESYRL